MNRPGKLALWGGILCGLAAWGVPACGSDSGVNYTEPIVEATDPPAAAPAECPEAEEAEPVPCVPTCVGSIEVCFRSITGNYKNSCAPVVVIVDLFRKREGYLGPCLDSDLAGNIEDLPEEEEGDVDEEEEEGGASESEDSQSESEDESSDGE